MSKKLLITAFIIFLFAFSLRMWNLGMAGRWSDEQALMEHGYSLVELIKQKDFSNPFWYKTAIDHPPFAFYFYGFAGQLDFIRFDPHEPPSYDLSAKGAPVFQYDLFFSRLVSVFVSSLSVVLLFLIGARYFSFFTGIMAALILAALPHFLGFSQFVDLESWVMLLFTACVFAYLRYLDTGNKWYLILTGILTGFAVETKEPNVLIVAFYFAAYVVWKRITKQTYVTVNHFMYLFGITLLTCFLVWPMMFLYANEYFPAVYELWIKNRGLTPDVFFGHVMGARWFYYPAAIMITTPFLILIMLFFGARVSLIKRKQWVYSVLLIWFFIPLLMMFFHHRQHMMRYIIEIYAPMSLLAALGIEQIVQFFTKSKKILYFVCVIVLVYLLATVIRMSPFYLTYYNELVGGTKNVYDNRLFLIGWFGEGLRAPGVYLATHAEKGSTVGLATNPDVVGSSIYRVPYLSYEKFDPNKKYDYVLVNYYNIIRDGFDTELLEKDYQLVYTEKVAGIDFASVYQRK